MIATMTAILPQPRPTIRMGRAEAAPNRINRNGWTVAPSTSKAAVTPARAPMVSTFRFNCFNVAVLLRNEQLEDAFRFGSKADPQHGV